MTTKIVRIGNTLMVEIPAELAANAALPVDAPVEWVSNNDGSLTLLPSQQTPTPKSPADMTLEELLVGLKEGDSLGEYDWGPPRGVEVW